MSGPSNLLGRMKIWLDGGRLLGTLFLSNHMLKPAKMRSWQQLQGALCVMLQGCQASVQQVQPGAHKLSYGRLVD